MGRMEARGLFSLLLVARSHRPPLLTLLLSSHSRTHRPHHRTTPHPLLTLLLSFITLLLTLLTLLLTSHLPTPPPHHHHRPTHPSQKPLPLAAHQYHDPPCRHGRQVALRIDDPVHAQAHLGRHCRRRHERYCRRGRGAPQGKKKEGTGPWWWWWLMHSVEPSSADTTC